MDVVWHHDKRIQANWREMAGDLLPTMVSDLPPFVQDYIITLYVAKQGLLVFGS
ncbi:MAG TPA: hypothetical protein VF982_02080 [Anaerolineales bacterium]